MTDPDVITAVAAAVVVGVVEGWRRTQQLGKNLGPRVGGLAERVAFIEGRLGITTPAAATPGTMEASDDGSRTGR